MRLRLRLTDNVPGLDVVASLSRCTSLGAFEGAVRAKLLTWGLPTDGDAQ